MDLPAVKIFILINCYFLMEIKNPNKLLKSEANTIAKMLRSLDCTHLLEPRVSKCILNSLKRESPPFITEEEKYLAETRSCLCTFIITLVSIMEWKETTTCGEFRVSSRLLEVIKAKDSWRLSLKR